MLALVHVLSSLIGRAFHGRIAAAHGLSLAEWRVMITLAKHPGASAADIVERWAMQPMMASRAIRTLEGRGWIARKRRSDDRRSFSLSLTAAGRRAHGRVAPDANARYRELLGCLSAAQAAALDRALQRLIARAGRLGR
ncbi:MAG TPA: MarR family winged helix-turn-helix transcriptional regulator [Burkholderiales bacterium]|nr:MarR family winged helix-turn-helix transcriptional regulator [Burkholderiales bacterium]